jgi:hypothetical protein
MTLINTSKAFEGDAAVDPGSLAQFVRHEIEAFKVPAPHRQQLGSPLPPSWYVKQLAEMKAALVEPYLIEMSDGRVADREVRPVWVVAEDAYILLAYDPDREGDFALIFRDAPQPVLSPIRGDAIGCFMSR